LKQVKQRLFAEFSANEGSYQQAGVNRLELERYINDRNYGLNSVDAILDMLCNACHVTTLVIGQKFDYSNPNDIVVMPGVMEIRQISSHHTTFYRSLF